MFNASCQNPDQTHMVGAVRLSLFFELFFDFPIDQGRQGARSQGRSRGINLPHAHNVCRGIGRGLYPKSDRSVGGALRVHQLAGKAVIDGGRGQRPAQAGNSLQAGVCSSSKV